MKEGCTNASYFHSILAISVLKRNVKNRMEKTQGKKYPGAIIFVVLLFQLHFNSFPFVNFFSFGNTIDLVKKGCHTFIIIRAHKERKLFKLQARLQYEIEI